MTNHSNINKHDKPRQIAMWNCPRSRSTAITRAFEQLDGCTIFDTPFYGAYLQVAGNESPEHSHPKVGTWQQDPAKIIAAMTEPLPEGRYVFQRHISRTVLPAFGRSWLASLNNFFLIRHPRSIIASYRKVLDRYGESRPVTVEDIGIDILADLFDHTRQLCGEEPLVLHSDDLAREPARVLQLLCQRLEIPFSERMLRWEPNLEGSALSGGLGDQDSKSWSETWYTSIAQSSGFKPYEEEADVHLPVELEPILEQCMPYYEHLSAHRARF